MDTARWKNPDRSVDAGQLDGDLVVPLAVPEGERGDAVAIACDPSGATVRGKTAASSGRTWPELCSSPAGAVQMVDRQPTDAPTEVTLFDSSFDRRSSWTG